MIKNYILKTLFCLCLLSFNILNGQEHITPAITGKNVQPIWQDEPIYREHLKKQGISDAVINKLVEEKLILLKSGRQIKWAAPVPLNRTNQNIQAAPYSDMGGENGWGAWQAQTGDYIDDLLGGGPSTLTLAAPGAPATPRFNVTYRYLFNCS